MILFSKIRVKNFLSYGNVWTEFDFLETKTTLISGKSGSGKSALNLDAVCFVLFNRAYRDINKPELVNDLNTKQMVVEIWFATKGKEYRVIRGMKPNVFEIYEDNELVDQDAANGDYQAYLEQAILGMTYKTFTQIAVIGSATYTPFMQLTTQNRRDVIEDLLNIKVFSTMNKILKQEISENKKTLLEVENTLTLSLDRATLQKKYVDTLSQDNTEKIQEFDREIEELTQRNVELKTLLKDELSKIEEAKSNLLDFDTNAYNESKVNLNVAKREKQSLERKLKDTTEYTNCTECGTPVDAEHREKHILMHTEAISVLETQISSIEAHISQFVQTLEKNSTFESKIDDSKSKMRSFDQEMTQNTSKIARIWDQKNAAKITTNIDAEKQKLKEFAKQVVEYTEYKEKSTEEKQYLDAMAILLKDDGIKSTIIKQYIPVINTLVNRYLQVLDLFVSFELDENFEESIKARMRDDKKYNCFSEGEKQRIDLALLFAWRQIATMNNSTNCNILVMDEVFDKSLDSDGIDMALNILSTVDKDTHVFVISHRGEALEQNFDRHVFVSKVNNYTELVYG